MSLFGDITNEQKDERIAELEKQLAELTATHTERMEKFGLVCAEHGALMIKHHDLKTQLAEIEKVNINKLKYWSHAVDAKLTKIDIELLCDILREPPEENDDNTP